MVSLRRVFLVFGIVLPSLLLFGHLARAAPILNDTFINSNNVSYSNPNMTTASVNTNPSGGYVSLSQTPMPNAIALKQGEYQYSIATSTGISTYSYNDATGAMALNPALSVSLSGSSDPTGIAVQQNDPNVWAITNNSLTLYAFNGSGMTTSPDLQATGLNNLISVTSWSQSGSDVSAVLSQSGQVSTFSTGVNGVTPGITFSTGISDPMAVSVLAGTPNLVVAGKNGLYYYDYNDATGNYVQNTTQTVSGLSGVLSASAQQSGTATLTNSSVNYYMENDAGGTPQSVAALSVSPISSPVGFSIKPGTYDYAILGQDGDVKYYTFNDATQTETENQTLEVSGLTLSSSLGYEHPEDYYSVTLNTSGNYDTAFLTINYGTGLPSGTSVQWYVSSDGGNTWTAANLGSGDNTMVFVPPGDQFVVHGILNTTVSTSTPKVYGVTLAVDSISGLVITPATMSGYPNSLIGGIQAEVTFAGGSPSQDVTGLVDWNITQNPTLVQPGAVVAYVYDYTTTSNESPNIYVLAPSGDNDGTADVYSGPYVGTADITASWSPGNGENFDSNTCVVTVTPDIPQSGVSGFIEIYRREVPQG